MTKLLLLLLLFAIPLLSSQALAAKKAYIVYLGGHSHGPHPTSDDFDRAAQSHRKFLDSILKSEEKGRSSSIFYSYTKHINGFVAMLEDGEAKRVSRHPGVISVFENREKKLHTTRSWDFLGGAVNKENKARSQSIWAKANFGEDVIISNIDTGVWPESESFNDEGYGPIPKRWKGTCESHPEFGFQCNRKLIGARFYDVDPAGSEKKMTPMEPSPRDTEGHGTHTLSTAAGNFVRGAHVFGLGRGTARGGAPRARVAAYKACGEVCTEANILAAFDDAIHDGVDVISVSMGGSAVEYVFDSVAVGSFHAVQKGILVVASGGNSGPNPATVENVAPWIFTVGASTIDRDFASFVTLGNNKKIKGASLSTRTLPENKFYPLIDGADARVANASQENARCCHPDAIDAAKVEGKIVLCKRDMLYSRVMKGQFVLEAGGVGMILVNDKDSGNSLLADPHLLPASMITYKSARVVRSYIKSSKSPTAHISPGTTQYGVKPAPVMASFSSRGPSIVSPEFLKPDITAPGVNVLAAFTGASGPSMLDFDKRHVAFNVLSGTSMSCPHISGIAGLLKKIHPDWSPAVIRSAIMTTARTRDNTRKPMKSIDSDKTTPFDYGAGHAWPNRAMDPGLVYDLPIADYVNFLCTRGYNSSGKSAFAGRLLRSCPPKPITVENLNYPSITLPNVNGNFTVVRTVRNVGGAPATYRAKVRAPFGIAVKVEPAVLRFEKDGEEKSFHVTVRSSNAVAGIGYVFGGLIWSDGKHVVRSPLVVNAFT